MNCALVFLLFSTVSASIIGEPKIQCAPTGITIMMNMDKEFKGSLFLRGSNERRSCKADFSSRPSTNISHEFEFDTCPSRRKRHVAPPRGMTMSAVLVVSYHGAIITHRDVAYQVECFYREETQRNVFTLLNVTAPKPVVLSDQPKLPICDYKVEVEDGSTRKGVVSSTLAGNAPMVTVGQSVVHIWTCSDDAPSDVYCMQVHSCKADDGDGEEMEVVDVNGCTTDGELLSPIRYNGQSMRAAAASQAFKFADKHVVYFKCAIRLTIKNPGEACPINNCESDKASVTRQTRSISEELLVFGKSAYKRLLAAKQYEILVVSPELLVEPEPTHNYIMSMYSPDHPIDRKMTNSVSKSFSVIVILIALLFI